MRAAFGRARRRRLTGGRLNLDHGAHPRMYAALEFVRADREVGASGCRSFFSATRWDKDESGNVQALWGRNRVTGNSIEIGNKAAAELGYGSKGVCLTADILDERRAADIEQHIAGLIAPLVNVLGCYEFGDELVKRSVAVTDAGAFAEHGVEADRLTIVEQPDLLVALNGGVCGETHGGHGGKREPNHCLNRYASLHLGNLLDLSPLPG